jgi:hypothetical protein
MPSYTTKKQLKRLKKKQLLRLCGYKNIKAAYKDLGTKYTITKKYLISMYL